MSYQPGLGPTLRAVSDVGPERAEPRIICDGCGRVLSVTTRAGLPALWFLRHKPAPGWRKAKGKDYCPRCTEEGRT
jgi:hypothetical protein